MGTARRESLLTAARTYLAASSTARGWYLVSPILPSNLMAPISTSTSTCRQRVHWCSMLLNAGSLTCITEIVTGLCQVCASVADCR